MGKETYKFALGQRVFLLGRGGICAIRGRGRMKSVNGTDMELYLTEGAHCLYLGKTELLSIDEKIEMEKTLFQNLTQKGEGRCI